MSTSIISRQVRPSKQGGVRANSGRPLGTKNSAICIPPSARLKVVDAMVRHVEGINISPMIVMLNDMKLRHDAARRSIELYENEIDVEEKKKYLDRAMFESGSAAESALRVAPYVHAKLQSVILKGDAENPLQLNFASLRGLTDKELEQMNALIAKSAMTIDV